MSHRDLKVLEAAEQAAVLVNTLIEHSHRRLIDMTQLQKAVMRVPLNIGGGFGRKTRPDRVERRYWPLHHRYVAIVKMLDALMNS